MTYFGLTVEHDLEVVAVAHSQLLAKNGDLAVTAISDKNRALSWPNHYGRIFALVNEALSDMLVDVQLTVVTEVDCKVFAIELTWRPE